MDFYPFKFDPSTGELSAISEITINIKFQTAGSPPPSVYLHSEVDQKASQIFSNYETARSWYESDMAPPPEPTYDLVIITSDHFIGDSTVFPSFVSHKEALATYGIEQKNPLGVLIYGPLPTPPKED